MKLFGLDISKSKDMITEKLEPFKDKKIPSLKDLQSMRGEGWEYTTDIPGAGVLQLQSFNTFYNNFINKQYATEIERINDYRNIAEMPEIADVIEDATNESTSLDEQGKILHLDITDQALANNENISSNITKEFNTLFYKNIKLEDVLWDMVRSYFIDGRVYYERVIDIRNKSKGILNLKKLPAETMDYVYNPFTGQVEYFLQYLTKGSNRPMSIEDAQKRKDVVLFYPDQIGFVNYGVYGKTRNEILGYLEKVKVPYNQIKLLETSVVIYRIIRAPERLVFRIDTGNMPRDKALKYVEKIKQKMTKKQTYNPQTGALTHEPEILCIRKNTEIPLLDGRYLTLEEIIKEYNDGKENWVYSINEKTKNIEPGKIINAKITRKNEKLIRIWLDNENYIDTTYDHKFITRDGSKCRADKLKVGQSLMPLYKKKERIRSNVKNEYEMIYNPLDNKWKWTHNIVSSFFNGKKEKGFVDHHKDFNPFNNNPNNLIRMHHKKHSTMHSECIKKAWRENYDFMYDAICRGRQTLKNNEILLNHKITKIEYINEKDDTGCMTIEGNHNFAISQNSKTLVFICNSMLENYYLPQSADGRGSQIETVGGNASGFTELDDVYYFARKMYRALKYPSSRVSAMEEKRTGDIMFGGGSTGEISRDEIKWSKFLERQQRRICESLKHTFLLHMEFKGLKKQYDLSEKKINIYLTPPSKYKEQMEANFIESRHNNYSSLADREEMSKYFLMKKYLKWDDETIKANVEGMKKDKELGFIKDEDQGF